MGAFFLYKTQAPINTDRVEKLFCAKGFTAPAAHVLGAWTLLKYRKQKMPHESFSVCQADASLFAVGTFAYKGQGLQKSLATVLADFLAGHLDQAALAGAYCFIVFRQDGITFLTDRMNLFHVFTNDEQTVFSSSFAAVLKAGPRKFRLNVPAVIENMLTGYIIGPETIVSGVSLVDARCRRSLRCREVVFLQHPAGDRGGDPARPTCFDACVEEQLAELDQYFSSFKTLVDEVGGVDIGLSGGYDSRVLLLMAKRHFPTVYAHSHFHLKPTSDETCAEKIASVVDVPLYRCSEAKQPAEMDAEEFERNLDHMTTLIPITLLKPIYNLKNQACYEGCAQKQSFRLT